MLLVDTRSTVNLFNNKEKRSLAIIISETIKS